MFACCAVLCCVVCVCVRARVRVCAPARVCACVRASFVLVTVEGSVHLDAVQLAATLCTVMPIYCGTCSTAFLHVWHAGSRRSLFGVTSAHGRYCILDMFLSRCKETSGVCISGCPRQVTWCGGPHIGWQMSCLSRWYPSHVPWSCHCCLFRRKVPTGDPGVIIGRR